VLPDLAERVLGQPVRRGVPSDVGGLADVVKSPIHATGVGLALYGARRHAPGAAAEAAERAPRSSSLWSRLTKWFSEIF
jgi:cell division protein FtsA